MYNNQWYFKDKKEKQKVNDPLIIKGSFFTCFLERVIMLTNFVYDIQVSQLNFDI